MGRFAALFGWDGVCGMVWHVKAWRPPPKFGAGRQSGLFYFLFDGQHLAGLVAREFHLPTPNPNRSPKDDDDDGLIH